MSVIKDIRVKFPAPFLKRGTVLYVDSRIGTSHFYIEAYYESLQSRFTAGDTL